jgi:hypothetical protein
MSTILLIPPATEPWSVGDAKGFLRVEHDDDDAVIGSLIAAARGQVVAAGRSHDDATATSLAVTPGNAALLPLEPVHVKAVRGDDGVHLSWIRRTRINGDTWSGEVPLGEDSEAYALDILSGGSVVRAIACTTSAALYANADELADFGAPQTSLRVRVAQLSSIVGAGHPAELTVNL